MSISAKQATTLLLGVMAVNLVACSTLPATKAADANKPATAASSGKYGTNDAPPHAANKEQLAPDLLDGIVAYERGDYAKAFKIFTHHA